MPKFELVPQSEAVKKTAASGRRGKALELYLFFIEELQEGKAGHLRPSEGETIQAIRRRLGAAARLAGKKLVIKRVDHEIYFWLDTEKESKQKRRERPRNSNSSNI